MTSPESVSIAQAYALSIVSIGYLHDTKICRFHIYEPCSMSKIDMVNHSDDSNTTMSRKHHQTLTVQTILGSFFPSFIHVQSGKVNTPKRTTNYENDVSHAKVGCRSQLVLAVPIILANRASVASSKQEQKHWHSVNIHSLYARMHARTLICPSPSLSSPSPTPAHSTITKRCIFHLNDKIPGFTSAFFFSLPTSSSRFKNQVKFCFPLLNIFIVALIIAVTLSYTSSFKLLAVEQQIFFNFLHLLLLAWIFMLIHGKRQQ